MAVKSLKIREITLTNFKNYQFHAFSFDEQLNCLVGKNGTGKTNLLDSIYYSCFTKSYTSSSDSYVTHLDSDFFRLESDISLDSENHKVEIKNQKQSKKEIWLDKSKLEKRTTYIGKFPCVIITPDDNQLLLAGSDIRRKFMDATIAQSSSAYLQQLMEYNRILLQRNAVLKSFYESRAFNKSLLLVYNEQLVQFGNSLFEDRKSFIEQFMPIFKEIYKQIFDGNELIDIRYSSDLWQHDFATLLESTENQDRNSGRTTKGLHTDDLIFELNGHPIRKVGSQGQQKTFLFALKLAQYEWLKQKKQIQPILLLDDIFDKLDNTRVNKIFELIKSEKIGQTFITDTDENRILQIINKNSIHPYKIITIGELQK